MRIAIKLYLWLTIIGLMVMLSNFFYNFFSSGEKDSIFSYKTINASAAYLEKIPSDQKYIIPGSKKVEYNSNKFNNVIKNSSYAKFLPRNGRWFSELTIIVTNNVYGDNEYINNKNIDENVKNGYKSTDLYKNIEVKNGCVAYRLDSEGTWLGYGVLVVDTDYIENDEGITKCVMSAFDYFSGFPILNGTIYEVSSERDVIDIDPDKLPSNDVRRAIIDAIYLCSTRGETDMVVPRRNNAKLTARPSHACIQKAIWEFAR